MKLVLSVADIVKATNGRKNALSSEEFFTGQDVSTDTRSIQAGSLFVPLKGEKFNGHDYIDQAVNQGATLALCEEGYFQERAEEFKSLPLILVDDSLKAYQQIAKAWRRKLNPSVIAITGSSGKTSTKEILAALLSHFGLVHKTTLNFNNEVGVPKTILELKPEHEFCILEMGMRARGEIRELAETAEPNIGIITNIGQAHIGELGSVENIAKAKWELAEVVDKLKGTCILLNSDQQLVNCAAGLPNLKIVWCGSDGEIKCLASNQVVTKQLITYQMGQASPQQVTFNLLGNHQLKNLLLCLGVIYVMQLKLPSNFNLEVPTIFGRNELLTMASGTRILNDAYNANPDSMVAALSMFCNFYQGRKIAVLSFMGELGSDSENYHLEIGQFCQSLPLEHLFVIGEAAKGMVEGAKGATFKLHYCPDQSQAISELKTVIEPSDIILFKASRSAKLENVINSLIEYE